MLLAVSGNDIQHSTPKQLHIHLSIIMSVVCTILVWGRFYSLLGMFWTKWRWFEQSGVVFTLGTFWL